MCLSTNWHFLLQEGVDLVFKKIELDFINKYFEHLEFKSSYTSSSIILSGSYRGVRVDRVLVCEVLKNSAHQNKCLRASYGYKVNSQTHFDDYIYFEENKIGNNSFCRKRRDKEHCADFKMDILKADSKRIVWLHRD
jgi:hypothetical protein